MTAEPASSPLGQGDDSLASGGLGRSVRATRRRQYEVALVDDLVGDGCVRLARAIGDRQALVVTTPTVNRLYTRRLRRALEARGVATGELVLACAEPIKTVERVLPICNTAQRLHLDREGLLISVGGGICSDLVTVAAAWIRRGIRHLRVPTTLIGQIDAAIGLKGAVNHADKKSYIGCFYPPTEVLIDPSFLASLPAFHLRNGVAEMIKIALVRDPRLFELIERHAVEQIAGRFQHEASIAREMLWRAVCGMLEELEVNPYETLSYERAVDFGHTFSPLIEAKAGWEVHHGEAVAIDMALSAVLAVESGRLDSSSCERILALMERVGLPISSPLLDLELCRSALVDAARHRGGHPNLVLPVGIGTASFVRHASDLTDAALTRSIRTLRERASAGASRVAGAASGTAAPILTFDLGGTSLRGALYCPASDRLLRSVRRATPKTSGANGGQRGLEELLGAFREVEVELLDGGTARRVAVGFPGPIDPRGNALAAPTLWGSSGSEPVPLGNRLQALWPEAQVVLLNDVSAAGYRYVRRDDEDFCIITVSSGIGHKIFVAGRPLTGRGGRGGEIGHWRVDYSADAPRCECGGLGHLGALASGRATPYQATRLADEDPEAFHGSWLAVACSALPGELTNEQIVEAFHRADPWTLTLVRRMAEPLGRAIGGIHLAAGIERFVIVGGFARALGPGYVEALCAAVGVCDWSLGADWPGWIELGEPDDDAGLIGAGRFAERLAASQA